MMISDRWRAHVVTLFPDLFPGCLQGSLLGSALEQGLWSLGVTGIREFATDKHHTVDAPPYGGGAGLLMKPDIVDAALHSAVAENPGLPLVYTSPRGKPFDQATAKDWAAGPGIMILCGRFEGIDQRVLDHWKAVEVSLGDFVLTGGEISAQAMLDATIRLLPGVLGNPDSHSDESFESGLLEYPQYTRPAEWQGHKVPSILLSGDHGRIAAWRREQSESITQSRRPDLFAHYQRQSSKKSDF